MDMHHLLAKLALLPTALLLTFVSSNVERTGPNFAAYSNFCGSTNDQLCMEPTLNGGFPLAYLSDTPGISVEGKLSFGEDEFRTTPFLFDLAGYFAVLTVGSGVMRRVRVGSARHI
jgi:hypothetical protein